MGEVVPPVPIPNTEVKRFSADDTEGATLCGKYAIARELVSNTCGDAAETERGSQGGMNGEPI